MQEAIHCMKSKNLKGEILKIDLAKAFDWVSWLYLKMILTHIGFLPPFIDWVMCCITSASFSVLINGSASYFFHVEQGLRQGCPLSPLLFMIIMEGLSRVIASTKHDEHFQGLKITNQCILTHLLFIDDVLIFLDGGIRELLPLQISFYSSQRPRVWKQTI